MPTPTSPAPPFRRPPSLIVFADERERVITELGDAFARERIELDVFEHRLTLAHRATTLDELQRLVVDLDPALTQALVPRLDAAASDPVRASVALEQVHAEETLLAFCGGLSRQGSWTPPRRLRVVACMGGVELDFREALLPPGVTELRAFAAMGGVQIVVPPGLPVEVGGIAILGGFDHTRRLPTADDPLDPLQPRLRVSGVALMGGVCVETRALGETPRAARRRRRRERRALRRGRTARALLGDGDGGC